MRICASLGNLYQCKLEDYLQIKTTDNRNNTIRQKPDNIYQNSGENKVFKANDVL
jgi:hypothetical protein